MYNYNLALKKNKQVRAQQISQSREERWIKRYNSDVKPKLLEHYDARINAFIKQIEQAPFDSAKLITKHSSGNFQPFKFTLKDSRTESGRQLRSSMMAKTQEESTRRASKYCPISKYEYRERQKQKQIPPKINLKSVIYRRWKHQRQLILQNQVQIKVNRAQPSKIGGIKNETVYNRRRQMDDNHSDIPSVTQDNVSLRYSINSQLQNIQRQARQYEKKMEIVEKKSHYKQLMNLEQIINDPKAKKSIRDLLVKQGRSRPRIKTQSGEVETDLFRLLIDKVPKEENI